jgi:hypothetical protein
VPTTLGSEGHGVRAERHRDQQDERIARGRLASPFTACEVYHNDWTGLTEPRVVGEALECLRELGWLRPEAAIARDGGRPTVRLHINPRVASL